MGIFGDLIEEIVGEELFFYHNLYFYHYGII